MNKRLQEKLEELDKRISRLIEGAEQAKGKLERVWELEDKIKTLNQELEKEKGAKGQALERISELEAKIDFLDKRLSKEKSLRKHALAQIQQLIQEIGEAKGKDD